MLHCGSGEGCSTVPIFNTGKLTRSKHSRKAMAPAKAGRVPAKAGRVSARVTPQKVNYNVKKGNHNVKNAKY